MTTLPATATARKSTSVDTQNQKLLIHVSLDRRLPARNTADPARRSSTARSYPDEAGTRPTCMVSSQHRVQRREQIMAGRDLPFASPGSRSAAGVWRMTSPPRPRR